MIATIHNDLEKFESLNMPIKIGNNSTALFVDSGSACSNLKKSFAPQVVSSNPYAN